MEGLDAWLSGLGLSPPPELQHTADQLRQALPAPGTPTDLAAPLSPAPETEEEEGEEEQDAAAQGESGRPVEGPQPEHPGVADVDLKESAKREAPQPAHGPAAKIRNRPEPYGRSKSC